mgnify:CR=1 FL=1
MKVTLKNGKDNVVDLDIVIPAKEAAEAYNRAVNKISQYVNIDGFRKGKAPRAIVEKHVGTERIKVEAIESLMPKTISAAIEENKLDVITQPSITSYDFEVGKDLTVTVKVETRPEVTLGEYKGLNLKVEDSPIAEDAEQKSIDNLLKQHATFELVVDRPASDKDTVVIDFEGYSNGEKIVGGEGKNYSLDLGNSNFIPGFAEQIVGKSVNDEFEINVKFPEEYHDEKLKGQPATFKIKIHEVKERVLPELNDAFAQKVGPFKTVDDLKADVKKYLETQRERTNKQNSENEIFKTVIDAAKVDIPQSMIDREVESLKNDYTQRLAYQGINWDALVKAQGGEDHLLETLKEDATHRIKNSLVIDKIAKTENIKLEQKDIEKKFAELATMYGMQQQDILKQLGHNPEMLGSLSQQALNDKVRDFLVSNNNVELVAPKK